MPREKFDLDRIVKIDIRKVQVSAVRKKQSLIELIRHDNMLADLNW